MNVAKKKILVLGLGISGRSVIKFLLKRNAIVTGFDNNKELISTHPELEQFKDQGVKIYDQDGAISVNDYDFVVVSPGIPSTHVLYKAATQQKIELIGEVELACMYLTSIQSKVIGITGTNGKTTTTLLITHILNQSDIPATALGNIGTPLTTEIDEDPYLEEKVLVLELSSFQLETLKEKVIDYGLILNITPDHLDRYENMQSYAKAKIGMKDCLTKNGKLFCYEDIKKEFGPLFEEIKCITYGFSEKNDLYSDGEKLKSHNNIELFLPESYRDLQNHDIENMMAAYLICKEFGVSSEDFLRNLLEFKKPAHRLEYVRTLNDVTFYDDSKGTNIDAVIKAVNTFNTDIILIAGGVDKGAAYTPWIEAFAGKVKCIFAIGQAAKKIKEDLSTELPVEERLTLEEAVFDATKLARPGQVVLLSPGCSSFDMFRDYVHRGEEFKRIVNAIS